MMESMSALNYLNFSYNKLTILPESMGCMVGLQELDLSHNSIVNIQRGKLKTLLWNRICGTPMHSKSGISCTTTKRGKKRSLVVS